MAVVMVGELKSQYDTLDQGWCSKCNLRVMFVRGKVGHIKLFVMMQPSQSIYISIATVTEILFFLIFSQVK